VVAAARSALMSYKVEVKSNRKEEEEGLHGVFKRLRRNGHQLIKGSCKQFNTD
jgi:hypothetical protein